MVDTTGQDMYDVTYYDSFLEVENFKTIEADSEGEARDKFWEDHDEDRCEILDVEWACMIPNIVR